MIITNGLYCVYIHTNKKNGKCYVGITSVKPEKRWENGYGYRGSPKFWKAIEKYGWDGFDHEIFATRLTKEEACRTECLLIKMLSSQTNGYNCFEGGNAPRQTKESIEKMIRSKKGMRMSEEARLNIKKSKQGSNHPNCGKHLSEKTKEKIGNANRGKKATEETKKKLSLSHKGYKPQCGRKARPVFCVETGISYFAINEASRQTGIANICIKHVCDGKQKTAGKYHWRYIESLTTIENVDRVVQQRVE